MSRKYDVAIIGSGPAGYVSAIRLRQLNKSVCVIDFDEGRLGGVCLNEGCIPVKSLLYSSKLFSDIKRAGDFGLEAEAKAPDMKKIVASSEGAASRLREGLKGLFKKYGIEFIAGRARLISSGKISVELKSGDKEDIGANKIIIATGSEANIPQGVKIDKETIITSREAVKLEKVPKTLLVMGAGSAGVELCYMFASFGSKVTLVEMMPNILPSQDEEASKALARILKKKGVEILTDTQIKSLDKKGEAVLDAKGVIKKCRFECALIAAGRKPNTAHLGLEKIGVKLKDGFIIADRKMRTGVKNIYAAGDVVNTPMYAHVAYREGIVAAEDIAGLKTEPIDYENVPNVVFSEPQLASVGLTEARAKELKDIAVSRHFFRANALAVATHSDEGFIKIIAGKKTRKILGVHIIGSNATEILHEFVVAKNSDLKIDDIAKAVHAHPTFSETAVDAAKAVFDKSIHG